jgi:beta-galactosidase
VTRNSFGKGTAWYVGTQPAKPLATSLVNRILADAGVQSEFGFVGKGIEIVRRAEKVFVMNHTANDFELEASLATKLGIDTRLKAYGCEIGKLSD